MTHMHDRRKAVAGGEDCFAEVNQGTCRGRRWGIILVALSTVFALAISPRQALADAAGSVRGGASRTEPDRTNILVVFGALFDHDGLTPYPDGTSIHIRNPRTDRELVAVSGDTDSGAYEAVFLEYGTNDAAAIGDSVLFALDVPGRLSPRGVVLSAADIAAGQVRVDLTVFPPISEQLFSRGDVDASGELNISDPIYNLAYQFAGGPEPPCLDAADDDDSGEINISDPIYSLAYQFAGGAPPPAPFPTCGPDPTADPLLCNSFAPCTVGYTTGGKDHAPTEDASGAHALTLGPTADGTDRELLIPVLLESSARILGLEFQVDFDPAAWRFSQIQADGDGFDFLSGRVDGGTVRVGGIVDLSLAKPLAPGRHRIGYLVFQPNACANATGMRLRDITLVRADRTVVHPAGSQWHSSGAAGSIGLRLARLTNPYRAGSFILLETDITSSRLTAAVYDVQGRAQRVLYDATVPSGRLEVSWDGRTADGGSAPSGVYYFRVTVGKESVQAKVLFLR